MNKKMQEAIRQTKKSLQQETQKTSAELRQSIEKARVRKPHSLLFKFSEETKAELDLAFAKSRFKTKQEMLEFVVNRFIEEMKHE